MAADRDADVETNGYRQAEAGDQGAVEWEPCVYWGWDLTCLWISCDVRQYIPLMCKPVRVRFSVPSRHTFILTAYNSRVDTCCLPS